MCTVCPSRASVRVSSSSGAALWRDTGITLTFSMYCSRHCLRTALRAAASTHRQQLLRQAPTLCALRLLKTSPATHSDAIATPPLDGAPKQYSPKIQQLVSDISSLTLLEVSDLNELLKKTLNIQDVGMMPMSASAVPAAQAVEEEEAPAKKEQTHFTVKLTELKAADKVKLIKEVKNCIQGLNLVQSKKLVESLPQEIRANVSKEEAEKLKAALEAAGGTVVLE
ncbi:large ribosomal subunit protein bL12m [Larimichthys crocea]|uniref:large ribosomal subunit protein bL12m n=1 Tax=Larimichthys crocea TaxID=215358 RepID=UPI000F5DA186|nr:39S ribosomal protein L12, mitochondrial [Larimichthys crocea]